MGESPDEIPPPYSEDADIGVDELRRRIGQLVCAYARRTEAAYRPDRLELVRSSYGHEEILAAVDVLLGGRLTMGPVVAAFEEEWRAYLAADFALMVNSGSSANLLMLAAMAFPGGEGHLRPGDEVIVPAVSWSTSLFPIAQVGCVPVLVDIDPATLNIDPVAVAAAIGPRTRAIMAVHLLGNPCDMHTLRELARARGLWLIEDACESHGASIDGRAVGTFGDLASFSFYFSHHMTTIEGGMICGGEAARWRDLLASMRAHGWIRDRSDRDVWAQAHTELDPRWLFVTTGYNVRPSEVHAAFGRVQLKKLPSFLDARMAVRDRMLALLRPYGQFFDTQVALPGHRHTAFGLALIVKGDAPFTRMELQAFLERHRIETRPIVGGNLARQPAIAHIAHRIAGRLPVADMVHRQGLMIPNHHNVTAEQQDYVIACLDTFVRHHAGGC